MNETFITKGIENDRYLKAVRLYKQFEEELVRELRNVSKDAIERRPDLFVEDASPNDNLTRRRTEPLGHMGVDNEMRRVIEDGERLVFHVCIEWARPEMHGHDEPADGSLCIVFYKIKNLDRPQYERVKQETQQLAEWDAIQFDDDIWNSDYGLFYIPVTDGHGVKKGFETLQDHFLEFADIYGADPVEQPN